MVRTGYRFAAETGSAMRLLSWLPRPLRRIGRRVLGLPRRGPTDRFMRRITGVIHVGANSGQERDKYHQLGLDVLWIEADPHVFRRLRENIVGYLRQSAINALVSDVDGAELEFFVANNEGQSSSIFEFSGHTRAWPEVTYVGQRRLVARRLDRLIEEHQVPLEKYPALVLDVQGAELRVLEGATTILPAFSWIQMPVADFDAYRGAPTLSEIASFLERQGFKEADRFQTNHFPGLGNTMELVFRRRAV
jgi:FkbM family methyltransferase